MMYCEVVLVSDLSRPIEQNYYEILDMTLEEFLYSEIKNFDPAKTDFLSVLVDGVKIRKDCWNYYNLKRAKSIKLILEPQGDPFSWVMIIVTIAAAAYSAYLAHKLSAKTGGSTKTGNSIYDVNAQGNSVKLNEVIPEQFGMIKRFPDYIADTHKFYRNNKRILDLSLCQGVGKFHHSSSGSDMYFGATPFNQMSEKIQFKIYEPDETLADNEIDSKLGWCWFNSSEISASGKELTAPSRNTDKSELVYSFSRSICVIDKETRVGKDKQWRVGDILKIVAPDTHVLLGDEVSYRAAEWYCKKYYPTHPEQFPYTEIKCDLDSTSGIEKNWILEGGHYTNFSIITQAEQEDPQHSSYGLISNEHYNWSYGDWGYYDRNEFCKQWGTAYIYTSGAFSVFTEMVRTEQYYFPESDWNTSSQKSALWSQIFTEDFMSRKIYNYTKIGFQTMIGSSSGNIYRAYYEGKTLSRCLTAVWDYAPSYVSPGTISQFFRRDSSEAIAGGSNIIAYKNSSVWNRESFPGSITDLYDKVGLVYMTDSEKPYKQINRSFNDFDDAQAPYTYYCTLSKLVAQEDSRETGYFKILEVKKINLAQQYYNDLSDLLWSSNEPDDQNVVLYRVAKCDEEGNLIEGWKCFRNNYTVNYGADFINDDEEEIQGFNVSVFDHVEE